MALAYHMVILTPIFRYFVTTLTLLLVLTGVNQQNKNTDIAKKFKSMLSHLSYFLKNSGFVRSLTPHLLQITLHYNITSLVMIYDQTRHYPGTNILVTRH